MGIKLYAALELRGEYDARIQTIKECLPENRRSGWGDDGEYRSAEGYDADAARKELESLEFRRRKINNEIQKANFANEVSFKSNLISITEALETRKALGEDIGALHSHTIKAARYRIVYKEGRDIEQHYEMGYEECYQRLDQARKDFREINRLLREASYQVEIDYQDED